jgi:hypothetical protein
MSLDEDEREILDAFLKGELKSIPNVKREIARYRAYAKAHRKKDAARRTSGDSP